MRICMVYGMYYTKRMREFCNTHAYTFNTYRYTYTPIDIYLYI